MKIIYISSSKIPSRYANSIQVMKMCNAFAKAGNDVVLFAPNDRSGYELNIDDDYSFYGVDHCFRLLRLPWLKIKGSDLIYGFYAAVAAKIFKPDLVYCRNLFGCFFSAKFGAKVVLEMHAPLIDTDKIVEWLFLDLIRSKNFLKLVVITNFLKNYFQKKFLKLQGKIQVLPDGAEPSNEKIEPIYFPFTEKRLQVGYVGHLYNGRGIELISELAKNCIWADFHIVGGSESDLLRWQHTNAEQNNLFFHGFVAPCEAEKFRISCDVLIAPYQKIVSILNIGSSANWMSPLKIFEYMSAGKPIICSDLPVIHEVLDHERNSLLCPPGDLNSWKNALERLRDDIQLRNRLGNSAKTDLLMNFSWDIRQKRIMKSIFSQYQINTM